jgi:hypothetical protein
MTLKQSTKETDIEMGVPEREMYVTLYRQTSSEHFIVWVLLMYPLPWSLKQTWIVTANITSMSLQWIV